MPQLTVSEIARLCDARVQRPSDQASQAVIGGLASLLDANSEQAAFLGDVRYAEDLERTQAGCVLIGEDMPCERGDLVLLRCKDPSGAFSTLIEAFAPEQEPARPGPHGSAVVDSGAQVHASAAIGALAVVGNNAQIGESAVIHAHVSVGADCVIGAHSVLHPGVVLYPGTRVGERCIIHAGTVLGSDGFGFKPTAEGWQKIQQAGHVLVEDDVEIGANCTVDCARFGTTRIGRGTKIDNLVHIGHNTQIGPDSLLIAQVGVAGSTHLGRGVIAAGQVGIGGHLRIGDRAQIGAGSKVLGDLEGHADYFGYPATTKKEALTGLAFLPKLRAEFRKLKQRIAHLEERS